MDFNKNNIYCPVRFWASFAYHVSRLTPKRFLIHTISSINMYLSQNRQWSQVNMIKQRFCWTRNAPVEAVVYVAAHATPITCYMLHVVLNWKLLEYKYWRRSRIQKVSIFGFMNSCIGSTGAAFNDSHTFCILREFAIKLQLLFLMIWLLHGNSMQLLLGAVK